MPPEEYDKLPYKCSICKAAAYDNVRSLNNHARTHENKSLWGSSVTTESPPENISTTPEENEVENADEAHSIYELEQDDGESVGQAEEEISIEL